MSIVTISVYKGTFAWAVEMLSKGHVLTHTLVEKYHYQSSPSGLWCRVSNLCDGVTEWKKWTPSHSEFIATDWELL